MGRKCSDALRITGLWLVALLLYVVVFGSVFRPESIAILCLVAFCSLFPAQFVVLRVVSKKKQWWLYPLSAGITLVCALVVLFVLSLVLRPVLDGLELLVLLSTVAVSFLPVIFFSIFSVNVLYELQFSKKSDFHTHIFWLNAILAGLLAYITSLVISFFGF